MIQFQKSSGQAIADKRADYARQYAQALDFAAAIDVMQQALDLAPDWAAGWYRLGEFHEKSGDIASAKSAYQRALELSDTDYLGAGLKLAFIRAEQLDRVPTAYAEALFDDYAGRFDNALVYKLHYCAPERMAAQLKSHNPEKVFANAVDLGCGTGLMGAALRRRVGHLTGIDISSSMLEQARSKEIYDTLVKADIAEALVNFAGVELVTAADVFMYMADLGPVFLAISKCLSKGGLCLFCTEAGSGSEPWQLKNTMRHAHSSRYIECLIDQNQLKVLAHETAMIRMDEGRPIAGHYYLVVKQTEAWPHAA